MYLIQIEYPKYDATRYTLPNVSRITAWKKGRSPEVAFGGFTRTEGYNRGDGGILEIAAHVGDVIRIGQFDNDVQAHEYRYYIVTERGGYTAVTLTQAYNHWESKEPIEDNLPDLLDYIVELIDDEDMVALKQIRDDIYSHANLVTYDP